jgi:glutathione S-transferase
MIQLHYYPSNASMISHIVLEEMGVPFELVLVNRDVQAHKSADYLKLNPNGLIPAMTDGDLVLYETAAICLHLADTHPHLGLAPALGTPERAHFYKWLMWLTNTVQPSLITYFYPDRYVAEGNVVGAAEVKARAQSRVGGMLAQLDDELGRVQSLGQVNKPMPDSPWFLGLHYSLLDAYVFTLCRWTRGFSSAPARSYPHLGPYLQRMLARPAVQRVMATEKIAPPLV